MSRTHAQQFANHTLPRAVLADPLALTGAITGGDVAAKLAALWEQAGLELAPIARVRDSGFAATLERRGTYAIAIITPPAPRVSGDPAMMALIGRGDGATRMATLAYYVLELVLDPATGAPSFALVSYNGLEDRGRRWGEVALVDRRWFADDAFALYAGRMPEAHPGMPELPGWYWWHALGGEHAVRAFHKAPDDEARFAAVRAAPVSLMPEIIDAGEVYLGTAMIQRLRDMRGYFRRAASLATAWEALVQRLSGATFGSPGANATRALPVIAEATQYGALARAHAYELEAGVRSRLALLGVDADANYALADELYAAARIAERAPRAARGSAPPPTSTEDPMWTPLFLDEADLPECVRTQVDEAFSTREPTFVMHGGLRAGFTGWYGDESSPLARVVDSRWVFRTAAAAARFLHAVAPALGDGLPPLPAPQIGDDALAFGSDGAPSDGERRSQVIVVRVGRVIARVQATEGAYAAASRRILHAAILHPFAARIVQRARKGLAAYWLAVASPSNAVAALVHSNGYDASRLLPKYPLLACPELPAAMASLGDAHATAARALASFQAQLRAHRWPAYRSAMVSLVRALLESDMGDSRVNAAHAWEIVAELGYLDPDPVWTRLDGECRARV